MISTDLNDAAAWPKRAEALLRVVEVEAQSRVAQGAPGPWADIIRRCGAGKIALVSEPRCDAVDHFSWMELEIWGEILPEVLLAERWDELVEALRDEASKETPGDPGAWRAALRQLDQRLAEDAFDPEPLVQRELRFYAALKSFRRRPSAGALRACLQTALQLVEDVKERTGHHPCGRSAWSVTEILARVLADRMTLEHRWALAKGFQVAFFVVFGQGEERRGLFEVPRCIWKALKKGEVVSSSTYPVIDPYRMDEPPYSGPWLRKQFEEPVSRYRGWTFGQLEGLEPRPHVAALSPALGQTGSHD